MLLRGGAPVRLGMRVRLRGAGLLLVRAVDVRRGRGQRRYRREPHASRQRRRPNREDAFAPPKRYGIRSRRASKACGASATHGSSSRCRSSRFEVPGPRTVSPIAASTGRLSNARSAAAGSRPAARTRARSSRRRARPRRACRRRGRRCPRPGTRRASAAAGKLRQARAPPAARGGSRARRARRPRGSTDARLAVADQNSRRAAARRRRSSQLAPHARADRGGVNLDRRPRRRARACPRAQPARARPRARASSTTRAGPASTR